MSSGDRNNILQEILNKQSKTRVMSLDVHISDASSVLFECAAPEDVVKVLDNANNCLKFFWQCGIVLAEPVSCFVAPDAPLLAILLG